ncbi:MAG: hypothetical protein KatS3mg003_0220 [Candidatus Nitrosocaldaceae archaeon]|nr:MAG: hypothetical protein KatS3mg003_0220 [Candidatus Nitrosocaldaceae archaeon]
MKKGVLREIISKAIYADNPSLYKVGFRDLDQIKELPLLEFIKESDNFNLIPITRIIYIKKGDEVLYYKPKR